MVSAITLLVVFLATQSVLTHPQYFNWRVNQRRPETREQAVILSVQRPCQDAGHVRCCTGTNCSIMIGNRSCYCDEVCHRYNDCCCDIHDIGCTSTAAGQATCPDLSSPLNGAITYSPLANSRTSCTVAQYTCNEGYTLMGDSSRTCQFNMTWNGTAPRCEAVTCPDLPPILNGTISYSPSTNSKTPGTVAQYMCNERYTLLGNPFRECQQNLMWNGTAPQCVETCPDLVAPENGNIVYKNRNLTNLNLVRTVAISQCNEGYSILFEADKQRVCRKSNGEVGWSGHDATCQVRSCQIRFHETGGCCNTSQGCQIGSNTDQCSCSVDCFTSNNFQCCPDIGCAPTTCTQAGLMIGNCSWSVSGCYVPGAKCFCDELCAEMGDCCMDALAQRESASNVINILNGQSVRTNPYSREQTASRFRGRNMADTETLTKLMSELRSMSRAQEISNAQQIAQWETIVNTLQNMQNNKN